MKNIMVIFLFFLFIANLSLATETHDEPFKLKFIQEDEDLLITLETNVNNSPHICTTHFSKDLRGILHLYYHIFQNRNLTKRSFKWITIKWRIPNQTKEEFSSFNVEGDQIRLFTTEIETLLQGGQLLLPVGK